MAASMKRDFSCFALRGSEGFSLLTFHPTQQTPIALKDGFPCIGKGQCVALAFSSDGDKCAITDKDGVLVLRVSDNKVLRRINRPRTSKVCFSSKGTYVCTWQPYIAPQGENRGPPNLAIWKSEPKDPNSEKVHYETVQKKGAGNWFPRWTADETLCLRKVNNDIHFNENNDFSHLSHNLNQLKIEEFALPLKQTSPHYFSAYIPGTKSQPSFVRMWKYPNFGGPNSAVGNKSFFKADRCEMLWNNIGSALLILTASDTSSTSYYGEQGLHFMDTKGTGCLVTRSKNGPVYSVEWCPDSEVFCVVYGFMPAKATLYNLRADPIFDFGTGPRNLAYFNPHGSILCLAGFGNLRGNIEFWDINSQLLISSMKVPDTTHFEWCPDGEHFMTATTAPRLRVGNGYKLWHLMGTQLSEWSAEEGTELNEATFQPAILGTFPDPKEILGKITENSAAQIKEQDVPKAYVPPHLRDNPAAQAQIKQYREEYEKPKAVAPKQASGKRYPVGMKPPARGPAPAPAKALASEEATEKPLPSQGKSTKKAPAPMPVKAAAPAPAKAAQPAPAPAKAAPAPAKAAQEDRQQSAKGKKSGTEFTSRLPPAPYTEDNTDLNKQIKKVYQKLQQIDVLKQRKDCGQTLNTEQLQKIGRQKELEKEMKKLKL